jgi:hypothetical protein
MPLLRRLLRTTGARVVMFGAAVALAFQIWVAIEAPQKLDPAIEGSLDERGQTNLDVELGFPPERFHILHLQEHGRIRQTSGNVVELRSVSYESAQRLARTYWIEEIRLHEGG